MPAFKLAELFTVITARDGPLNRTLAGVRGKLQKTRQSMIGMAGAAKGMLVAAAGGAGIGAVIKVGIAYEQSMARVKALTGAADAEMQALSATARELGASTKFSARQAADAMSEFALAGFKSGDIVDAMRPTLNLAAAGMLSMGEASGMATAIMGGMGMTAQELGGAVDVLAKAFTTSRADLAGLSAGMRYVGPVAKSAGIEFAELVAVLQATANAGIEGSMAGAQLRQILGRLAGTTPATTKMLKEFGVTTTDAGGKLLPLADIIEQLETAFQGLGPAARTAALGQMFGAESAAAMTAMVGAGADELRRMTRELRDSGGTAERVAKIQMATLGGRLTQLKSGVEELMLRLYDGLKPALTVVVSMVQKAVEFFSSLNAKLTAMAAVAVIVAGIGAVLLAIVGPIIAGVAVLAIKIGLVVAVLTALGALLLKVAFGGETWAETMANAGEWVKKAFGRLTVFLKKAFEGILFGLAMVRVGMRRWKDAIRLYLIATVVGFLAMAGEVKHTFTERIPAYLRWFADNFKAIFETLGNNFVTFWKNLGGNIQKFFTAIWDFIKTGKWDMVWTPLKEGFIQTFSDLPVIAARELGKLEGELVAEGAELMMSLARDAQVEAEKIRASLAKAFGAAPKGVDQDALKRGGQKVAKAAGEGMGQALGAELNKAAGQFVGVLALSRRIQEAAMGKGSNKLEDLGTQQLAQQRKQTGLLEKISKGAAGGLPGTGLQVT